MSRTFTPEWIRATKLINSKNWGRIFLAINKFRHLKGWRIDSDEWFTIHKGLSDDFLSSEFYSDDVGSATSEQLTGWLLSKFDFDFVELNDIDRQSLKVK